jgi:hypothetical protein
MDLAETELERAPVSSPIEGIVARYPYLWWRRAVRRADVPQFLGFDLGDDDEFHNQACDYVIVYRLMTSDERIKFSGVAIGGSFLAPTVVTEPAPGCPSAVIHDQPGIVVVPVINGFPPQKLVPAHKRVPAHQQPSPGPPATRAYTVQPGDSLWDISERLLGSKAAAQKIDQTWRIIYRDNRSTIGADPNRIFPGQVLPHPNPS